MVNNTLSPPGREPDSRLRRRDPEALGALFDRFAPNVYALLAPVEADATRLDQLVEDVFWEAWTSAGQAGSESNVLQIMLRAVSSRLRGHTPAARPKDKPMSRGKTVLLVEDNDDNQVIYSLILSHHGYAVLQARDGERGVQMARDHLPDLILMDLTIPVIDGLQATRMLKADPATSGIPIIALTAHVAHEDRTAAKEAGCISFLSKPVEPRRMAVEVLRILALREPAVP